jgi:toxin CcdB
MFSAMAYGAFDDPVYGLQEADRSGCQEGRVVVPLHPASALKGKALKTLTPLLLIEGEPFAMLTPQLAGIPKSELGAPVTQVPQHRMEIIAAIDLLVTGI